jgi:hypothetical protein
VLAGVSGNMGKRPKKHRHEREDLGRVRGDGRVGSDLGRELCCANCSLLYYSCAVYGVSTIAMPCTTLVVYGG